MTSFINDSGEELQYFGAIGVTKQSITFPQFKLKGDVSLNFDAPNNSYNRKVLGYYGLNQIDSPVYSENYFNLVVNGNIIGRGKMVIQEDDKESLNLFYISGNSNWFGLLNFSCRDIRNDSLSLQANWTSAYTTMGLDGTGAIVLSPTTEGIVFPFIDWLYKGQKFDEYFLDSSYKSTLGNSDFIAVEIFPTLYVKTLVAEIAKTAGIKIDGTLISDAFYNTLIVTPENCVLIDPATGTEIDTLGLYTTSAANYITIGSLAPDMKAVDFIKWLCLSFGVMPYFDEYSKKLTLNVIDKFRKDEALDWSEYYRGHKIYYNISQNNYIRVKEPSEDVFDSYNESHSLKYGEANLESEKTDGSEETIYTSPFKPVLDFQGDTPFAWCTPYIPMFELEDDEVFEYTSVTIGTNSTATFNGSGYPFDSLSDYIIFRVVDDSGVYDGYHTTYVTVPATATTITSKCAFISNSSGKIYTQSVKKGNPGARILSYIPRISATDVTADTNFYKGNPGSGNGFTSVSTAYHYKETTGEGIDTYKKGLSYGSISGHDVSLVDSYLSTLSKSIKGPKIRFTMQLPESDFNKFIFDKYIFVKTKDLTGYFLVESISNYKDSKTLVEVNVLSA